MKLWIYEIHIFELRNKKINGKKFLAVIKATYRVAKRKAAKIRLAGIRTLPLRCRCSALTNWANKPTGSWSLNWFVIYPGNMKMKIWKKSNFPPLPRYVWFLQTSALNNQLPVGLIAQLVRALHRYRRGQGSNPGKPDFCRLSFRNCISCVNNCKDLLYIYFFIPQFKYMNFTYSQFHLHLSRVYYGPI